MGRQLIVSMELHSEEEVPLIRPLFPNVEGYSLLCKIGRRANKVLGSPCPVGDACPWALSPDTPGRGTVFLNGCSPSDPQDGTEFANS